MRRSEPSFACRMTVECTHIGASTTTGCGADATQSIALASSRR